MAGGEKSFDFAVDRLETYKGRADFYNMRKVSERGHDISRLPYSIKILLENAIRHSKTVEGATEAANRLLEWPRSIGAEFPFMPYRVLLQDYTGVPLIVDLAAMRDAMLKARKGPGKDQLNRAHRPRHRPLRPGRQVGQHPRLRIQHRERVREELGEVCAAQVGAGLVQEHEGLPAWQGDLPPGQPRVPLYRRGLRRPGREALRVPRHRGRH